jgi:hypothetical protein
MSVHSVSNPQPTQAPSSMAQILKNLEQAIQNTSAELQQTKSTDQPSRVLEDMNLDEVDKIETIVLSATKEKPSPFASLIPYIDFVIPDIFSGVVEQHTSLFSMLSEGDSRLEASI